MRICIWCGKEIPNFRQKRCKTCSIKCMHDHSHAGGKQREERLKRWKAKSLLKRIEADPRCSFMEKKK